MARAPILHLHFLADADHTACAARSEDYDGVGAHGRWIVNIGHSLGGLLQKEWMSQLYESSLDEVSPFRSELPNLAHY